MGNIFINIVYFGNQIIIMGVFLFEIKTDIFLLFQGLTKNSLVSVKQA